MFVNYFRTAQIQYMLFWLLKDALLGLQKMLFKALINALLKAY